MHTPCIAPVWASIAPSTPINPMQIPGVFPSYEGHGLLNLISSCLSARGGRPLHPGLSCANLSALAPARNVVLLIIDGLGYNYLSRHTGSALHSKLAARMTSVFPSTTASAITTTFTGLSPAEHGLTGWYAWFPEAGESGSVVAPLPFKLRNDARSPTQCGIEATSIYAGAPMFDGLGTQSLIVSPRDIIDSGYNVHYCGSAQRLPYSGIDGLVAQTEAAVKSGAGRKFVYAYTPEFDACAHRHGVISARTEAVFASLDAAFDSLLKRLSGTDTALVVTADHGFIDSPAEHALDLADSGGLADLLRLPLTGERRAAFCHVLPGREREFAERAAEWLEGRADVVPGSALVEAGYFGGANRRHPHLRDRAGDFALLMREDWTVKDWLPGEPRVMHIGNHGGLSPDEMYIPLVLAEL